MKEYFMVKTQNPLREGTRLQRTAQPSTLIILGATGDLTKRKLIPSLYNLFRQGLLPTDFKIVAFARRPKDDDSFRKDMEVALNTFVGDIGENGSLKRFLTSIYYHRGDFNQLQPHKELKDFLVKMENKRLAGMSRSFSNFAKKSFNSL